MSIRLYLYKTGGNINFSAAIQVKEPKNFMRMPYTDELQFIIFSSESHLIYFGNFKLLSCYSIS